MEHRSCWQIAKTRLLLDHPHQCCKLLRLECRLFTDLREVELWASFTITLVPIQSLLHTFGLHQFFFVLLFHDKFFVAISIEHCLDLLLNGWFRKLQVHSRGILMEHRSCWQIAKTRLLLDHPHQCCKLVYWEGRASPLSGTIWGCLSLVHILNYLRCARDIYLYGREDMNSQTRQELSLYFLVPLWFTVPFACVVVFLFPLKSRRGI